MYAVYLFRYNTRLSVTCQVLTGVSRWASTKERGPQTRVWAPSLADFVGGDRYEVLLYPIRSVKRYQ